MRSSPGAEGQLSEFVAAQYGALVRWAYLLTGELAAAQDLTQSALERLCVRWSRVRDQQAPGAYVRRTILTLFLNERRRHGTAVASTEVVGSSPRQPATVDPIVRLDDQLVLDAALKTLPRAQRAALVLRYYDDLSVRDTATFMRCSESAVKTHTARALARLQGSGLVDDTERTEA
ncbi:MAG: SigE family RNA polymerase sigma factor [Mycobacteriales bacterium]|nr:MAG: SigE family RNA polymerase sigma factor [Pseudonocardiales bacterium]